MDAYSRRHRGVANIVGVVATENAWKAGGYRERLLAWAALLQNPRGHNERSRGIAVIMESGGLARHPADGPDVIFWAVIYPFIPAVPVA